LNNALRAYDLSLPSVSLSQTVRGGNVTMRDRLPAWVHNLPDRVGVAGIAADEGKVYVALASDRFNSAIHVYYADDGKVVWWTPFPAALLGTPALTTEPSGQKVVLAAFRSGDGTGGVWALNAATGQALWTSNLEFNPTGPPAEAAGIVVIGGVGKKNHPGMAGIHLVTGKLAWLFNSQHDEPGADEEWEQYSFLDHIPHHGSLPGLRQPGGVAASGVPGGGSAYFACGRRLYAVDLLSGRPRWELEPAIDPQVVKAVNAIVDRHQSTIKPSNYCDTSAACSSFRWQRG